MTLAAINERVTFFGGPVSDACRFWFDKPAVDDGQALRLAAGSTQKTKFERAESEHGDAGPVLTVT